MTRSRLAVALAAGVMLLTSCTTTGSSTGSTASVTSTGAPVPSASALPSVSSSASPSASGTGSTAATDLKDGRYPAYVVKVNAAGHLVTIDVVQFFTGKAAATAAAGDHSAEVPPPNDYWIRNTSKRLRTLAVAADAPVTVNVLSAADSGDATKDTPVTLAKLATYPMLGDALFWVTVKDGFVSRLAEQFLP